MPDYQIAFVGGGALNRPPINVVCVGDQQALDWAAGLLAHHLGAEISNDGRQVGWVTTANNSTGVTVVLARS
jgi:hypothetical protein